MLNVVATAIIWGMLAYSVTVLGIVVGLAVKLALLFKDRGVLRMELADAERRVSDATKAAKGAEAMIARYRKEIEVLNEELDSDDADLGLDGVAERLERLLSGEVPKDDPEDREGGNPVPTSGRADPNSGEV